MVVKKDVLKIKQINGETLTNDTVRTPNDTVRSPNDTVRSPNDNVRRPNDINYHLDLRTLILGPADLGISIFPSSRSISEGERSF